MWRGSGELESWAEAIYQGFSLAVLYSKARVPDSREINKDGQLHSKCDLPINYANAASPERKRVVYGPQRNFAVTKNKDKNGTINLTISHSAVAALVAALFFYAEPSEEYIPTNSIRQLVEEICQNG